MGKLETAEEDARGSSPASDGREKEAVKVRRFSI